MNSFSLDRVKNGVRFFMGIFFSRLFGFLRDIVMAFLFGGNFLTDAFNLAYKIPNMFRQVFGESMYERAFMPPFNRLRNSGQYRDARKMILTIFLISQVLVLLSMALVYFGLPWILQLLAAGFDEKAMDLPLRMSRIFLPYMFIISLATFTGALLRYTHKKEFLYGFSPSIQNILLMICMVALYKSQGIFSMVYGYLIGSFGFFLVQAPSAWKIIKDLDRDDSFSDSDGKERKDNSQTREEADVKKAFGQGGHIFLAALFNKSIDFVDAAVASLTGFGSISALAYSRRIVDLPITLFGMAFSSLPFAKAVSDLKGQKKVSDIPGTISSGIKTQIILMAPISLFCLIFSTELMTIFFKRGAFDELAVQKTALAFSFFALGMVPMGMRRFFAEIYPAIEDSRPLVWVSFIGAVVNIGLDFALYQTPLRHGGIALATSVSYLLQTFVLMMLMNRSGISLSGHGLSSFALRTGLGLVALGVLLFLIKVNFPTNLGFWSLSGLVLLTGGFSFILFLLVTVPFLVKRKDARLRLILTGGGTGGHVYPSLAIYEILKKNFEIEDVCYLGMKTKAESTIVANKGLAFKPIVSAPLAGVSPAKLLRSIPLLMAGTLQSMLHILRFNPNTVVASGGYVSAPVVFAAALLRPFLKFQIVLHEQNLVPGFMNKVASLLADLTFVNYRESAFLMWNTRCVQAGYPVRKEFQSLTNLSPSEKVGIRKDLSIPEDAFVVLAYGGSIGARSINQTLVAALPRLQEEKNLFIIHGVGLNRTHAYHALNETTKDLESLFPKQYDPTSRTLSDTEGRVYYRAFDYLHNLGDYQKASDLIICRAGAGSLAEIMALGQAALVVPKRGLPGNHQELNAIELREKQACDLLFESWDQSSGTDTIDPTMLVNRILELKAHPDQLQNLREGAASCFFKNSERAIADALRDFIENQPVDYITTIEEPAAVKHQRLFDSLVDHLGELPADHILRTFYRKKADEYLKSSQFLVVNKGIKLMNVFPEPALYQYVYDHFDSFKGFLKRNALVAMASSPNYYPEFRQLIRKGITDSYFETRREAIALYRRFFNDIQLDGPDDKTIENQIQRILRKRFESFEVKVEAIRASVLFLPQKEFEKQNRRFLFSQNMRLRYGLLEAVEDGLNLSRFENIPEIRKFVKQILLINADFIPNFKIRNQFMKVAETLRQVHPNNPLNPASSASDQPPTPSPSAEGGDS